jgi:uncharacterized protein YlxW (UPF0749 family)
MSVERRYMGPPPSSGTQNLADILERVLDKGIVIAGDIQVNLLDIELLTVKLRLLVASVDKAREIGIDWWQSDPYLSADSRQLEDENRELKERIDNLESTVRSLEAGNGSPTSEERESLGSQRSAT